jgi:hypothetical protein
MSLKEDQESEQGWFHFWIRAGQRLPCGSREAWPAREYSKAGRPPAGTDHPEELSIGVTRQSFAS